jgi:ribose transport system permease protein
MTMTSIDSRPQAATTAVSSESAETVTRGDRVRQILGRQEVTLVGVIIAFGVVMGILNPTFLSAGNLLDLVSSTVVYFVVACGLTLVIVAGGFDFSAGSMFTLGGISATWLMSLGVFWPIACIIGIVLGGAVGLLNAVVIDRLHVPAIITTLGMFYFIGGAVVLFTGGNSIGPLPDSFDTFGSGSVFSIPYLIFYGIVIGAVYHVVLERTRFGYNVKAVGGGLSAAIANGISARRTNLLIYGGGAAIAALGGILYSARTGSGSVSAGGSDITLTAVSAVLIGGTSLFGGVGTITGTALGALLFATIDNGLAVANVPALYSDMIIGAILVLAVAVDAYRRRRSFRVFRK